jgi:hypothetical protein
MPDLDALARRYGSDKTPSIKHHYTEPYQRLLAERRQEVRVLVEIGIGYPEVMFPGYIPGASLRMWRDFLPRAQIYGLDLKPELLFSETRISTVCCDATQSQDLERLLDHTGREIDVFIDDGSHHPDDQIFTCSWLLAHLWPQVIYVIEDVHRPDRVGRELRARGFQTELLLPRRQHGRRDDQLMRVSL